MGRLGTRLVVVGVVVLIALVLALFAGWYRERSLGELVITSGTLLVVDPSYLPDTTHAVKVAGIPRGRYPVVITVVSNVGDQRVARAELRISSLRPSSRKLLGEMMVDSGTGCMIDEQSLYHYREETQPPARGTSSPIASTNDRLWAAMDKTYVSTYSVANLTLDKASGANMVAFSTGYGDGTYRLYASYSGKSLVKLELEMLE